MELSDGQIEVHKFPLNDEPAIYTVYVLQKQPTVHLVSLQFSSYYDILHHDLEMAGKLDHSIASCPERRSPKAREIVDAFCRMERSSNPAGGITRPYELRFRLLVLVERIQEAVNILLRQVIRRGQPQLVRVASSDANFLFFP
jgi:hypothetical protein